MVEANGDPGLLHHGSPFCEVVFDSNVGGECGLGG